MRIMPTAPAQAGGGGSYVRHPNPELDLQQDDVEGTYVPSMANVRTCESLLVRACVACIARMHRHNPRVT